MKEIHYRGGLLTFDLPKCWVEEYADDGGGIFYENSPASGTLRLNVMTFEAPNAGELFDVDQEVRVKAKESNGITKFLDEGNAVVRYDNESNEDGHNITIRYWQVYNPVPPSHLRIAAFSYTLLSSQFGQPKYVAELEMLDHEISKVRFATSLGQ